MQVSPRVINTILVGASALLLTHFFSNVRKHQHKRVTKKLHKAAVQEWEGEGGNIIDPAPRAT